MKDLTIGLENRPGAVAEMSEVLGRAGGGGEGGSEHSRAGWRRPVSISKPCTSITPIG